MGVTLRPDRLPIGAVCYRTVGPFDLDSLPDGLRKEHRLKTDVWGLLTLSQGSITFVWDDERGGEETLHAPAIFLVPPEVPHHLRVSGPFLLTIGFHRTD